MKTQNETENKTESAAYETLGEPATILVGKTGFVEVAHRRATFSDRSHRDFILIARGHIDRAGRKRTQRLVMIPAEHAPAVARARPRAKRRTSSALSRWRRELVAAPFRCRACGGPTRKAFVDAAAGELVGYCAEHPSAVGAP
jgi:predicted Zn-ribbon and HTH transcriptional regulator